MISFRVGKTMEFHEKLQLLRKNKNITQEELAQLLYVSRAAVSKWESGIGYPNIDSLKSIAKFYGVTIDELLSGEEILTIAEEEQRLQKDRLLCRIFGILDLSAVGFLFLPFFAQRSDEMIRSVSLLSLTGISPWLTGIYYLAIAGLMVLGILAFVTTKDFIHHRHTISLLATGSAALIFILSLQPYAAAFLFLFFAIKVILLAKKD